MNTRMLLSLEQCLENWLCGESDHDDYPREWSGNETAILMARAAASVFDAVVEVQQYLEAEGYKLHDD